ncbi:nucleoside-triphosphatase [Ferruginibacter sp.]
MSNKIIILTGEIQIGKTTLLQQVCVQQKNMAGILTPVVNGKRMFYNIETGDFFAMEANEEEEKLSVGKYLFSATAFAKANDILLSANQNTTITHLIIDEIGPLELKQQKGLYNSFNSILHSSFKHTLIIVVRRALVETVISAFNLTNAAVMDIAKMKAYFSVTGN